MLTITIPSGEAYDEEHNKFIDIKGYELQLEHSLISISKWESIWHKPYLHTREMTIEEEESYIKCMTLNKNIPDYIYSFIPMSEKHKIQNYIDDPMTAATFNIRKKVENREITTSETIYCWMISLQIPFECEKWHLNRLIALIEFVSIKNQSAEGSNKMSDTETAAYYRQINQERRKALAEAKAAQAKVK